MINAIKDFYYDLWPNVVYFQKSQNLWEVREKLKLAGNILRDISYKPC